MRPIKVLYIVDSFAHPYAGTEGQIYKLISNLNRDKFEPHLLMFNSSDYIRCSGFPCDFTVLGCGKLSSPKTWLRLFYALKQKKNEGFDLAHIFFNDPSIICPPLLKLLDFKTIISRRDMGYWYTVTYLALLRINAKLIDLVIVNSKAVKNVTQNKEWITPSKIKVIYNGYEYQETNDLENLNFKQSDEEIVLGIVANIRSVKRIQDAVEATASLNRKGLNVRLVVVGGGDPCSLECLTENLSMRHKVEFAGSQQNTTRYIKGFDICLLTSESEGFSNSIIEYMQFGKPVVCSDVGGNSEVIDDGEVGYLYPVGNVDALVSRLEVLCKCIEKRVQFGLAGHVKVTSLYDITRMVNQHESNYQRLFC